MTSLAKTRKDFNVAFSSLKFQPFSMLAHRQLSKTENIGRTIFIKGYYFLSLSLKKPGPQSKYPVLWYRIPDLGAIWSARPALKKISIMNYEIRPSFLITLALG